MSEYKVVIDDEFVQQLVNREVSEKVEKYVTNAAVVTGISVALRDLAPSIVERYEEVIVKLVAKNAADIIVTAFTTNSDYKDKLLRTFEPAIFDSTKALVYDHADEILERLLEKASREMVKRGIKTFCDQMSLSLFDLVTNHGQEE